MVIRRFDVLRNPSSASNKTFPYLLVVQSEFLHDLPTRAVVPLTRARSNATLTPCPPAASALR